MYSETSGRPPWRSVRHRFHGTFSALRLHRPEGTLTSLFSASSSLLRAGKRPVRDLLLLPFLVPLVPSKAKRMTVTAQEGRRLTQIRATAVPRQGRRDATRSCCWALCRLVKGHRGHGFWDAFVEAVLQRGPIKTGSSPAILKEDAGAWTPSNEASIEACDSPSDNRDGGTPGEIGESPKPKRQQALAVEQCAAWQRQQRWRTLIVC